MLASSPQEHNLCTNKIYETIVLFFLIASIIKSSQTLQNVQWISFGAAINKTAMKLKNMICYLHTQKNNLENSYYKNLVQTCIQVFTPLVIEVPPFAVCGNTEIKSVLTCSLVITLIPARVVATWLKVTTPAAVPFLRYSWT